MYSRKFLLSSVAALLLAACSGSETVSTTETPAAPEPAKAALSGNVEITLIDKLDGVTSSYCIDIAGGNSDIDITKGLQAHTCYSYRGDLGADQTFDSAKFANNQLYMPQFDVCAVASSLEAGASLGLAPCDGSEAQRVSFSGRGTISMMAAPEFCFTAAKATRFGRSKVHQIKALSLETCSSDLAGYQAWRGRSGAE